MAPRERHPTILSTFDALQPGEALELVNDHDPKPLRYQFEAEKPGDVHVGLPRAGAGGLARAHRQALTERDAA